MITALHILGHRPLPPVPADAPVRQVRPLDGLSIAAVLAAKKHGATRSCRDRADMLRDAVIAYLRQAGEPVPRAEIAEDLDVDPLVISDRLTELGRMGRVTYTRDGRGVLWSLAEAGK